MCRRALQICLTIFLLVSVSAALPLVALAGPAVFSWYATSTNFFVHPQIVPVAGGNPTYSFSTSTSYKMAGAGGEAALGTSTSANFGLQAGFVRNLYKGPAPVYEQIHYHWRNDDGSESAASSGTSGSQDAATSSVPKGNIKRLRIEIANRGGTLTGYSAQQFRLEYALNPSSCSSVSSWTDVGASGGDWDMANSANLTDGGNTTDILLSKGGVGNANHTFLAANGGTKDTGSQTSAISLPSDSFIELEYSITALSAATDGGAYCFRVTNASSPTYYLYTVYPQATLVAGATSLSVMLDSNSQTFPALTPGILVATSSIIYVKTDNASGFNVTVSRVNPTATLLLSGNPSVSITDNTNWVPGANCAASGNGIASTTNPNTLQFRVKQAGTDSGNYCSAWWGSDDTVTNAKFAGFPATTQKIIDRASATSGTSTAAVLYNLNVSPLQQTGTYTGSITYTVTTNL